MKQFFYITNVIILLTGLNRPVAGADKVSLETGTGLDGAMRWRGNGLLRVDDWAFGVAGRLDPEKKNKGFAGINGPFIALGHLSDSGMAAEIRNPTYTALGRLTEKTFFKADLKSFSDSRYGAALYTPNRKYGVAVEHRDNIDAGLIWLTPIQSDLYRLEFLLTAGQLAPNNSDSDWYPDEPGHPGGVNTSAITRNSFDLGYWTFGVSSIVSGGDNFRPGVMLAIAADGSRKAWKTRIRGTWASEFYRSSEAEILNVPSGIAWDSRLAPKFGLILGGRLQIPLIQSRWNTKTEDETGKMEAGWDFKTVKLLGKINWIGLSMEPNPPNLKDIGGSLKINPGQFQFDLSGKWDFKEDDWSFRLSIEKPFGSIMNLGATVQLHEKTSLKLDCGLNLTFRIEKTLLMLKFNAADLPDDWEDGPSSGGDMDIEIRWIQKF